MPKFIKFSLVVNLLLWGLWFYLLFIGILPNSYREIFLFLSVLFLAMGLTFSFPFYFFYKKKYKNFTDLGILYKKALKWGFFVSFGVVAIAIMEAFHILTLLNVALLALLYLGFFVQLRGRK